MFLMTFCSLLYGQSNIYIFLKYDYIFCQKLLLTFLLNRRKLGFLGLETVGHTASTLYVSVIST